MRDAQEVFYSLSLGLILALTAAATAEAATYHQTLTPEQVWCYRPNTCAFTFTDALEPTGDGTLSVLGSGDINEYSDYVPAYIETISIGTLWGFDRYCVGPGGSYTFEGCVDTVNVPLSSLLSSWSDGRLTFSFVVDGTVGGVIFESLRLTYPATLNSVPLPSSIGLLGIGLAALGLARRRGPVKT